MDGNKETKIFGRTTMFDRWIVSYQAWRQNRKNRKQIDSINALNKKILEYDLRFLENPLIHIPKKSKTKIYNNN